MRPIAVLGGLGLAAIRFVVALRPRESTGRPSEGTESPGPDGPPGAAGSGRRRAPAPGPLRPDSMAELLDAVDEAVALRRVFVVLPLRASEEIVQALDSLAAFPHPDAEDAGEGVAR